MSKSESDQRCILKIAVPGPFLSPLDYLAEPEQAVIGARVWIPFRQKSKIGVVMAVAEQSDYDREKLKSVESLIDATAVFTRQHLQLLSWASQYYHEPIGEVVMSALPKRLRQGEPADIHGEDAWQLLTPEEIEISPRAKSQEKLFHYLSGRSDNASEPVSAVASDKAKTVFPVVSGKRCKALYSGWKKTLDLWHEQGWVRKIKGRCWDRQELQDLLKHPLNLQQQAAVDEVAEVLRENRFQPFLLQGVTGSGKTEVYLAMIELAIQQGKQVLVLVPEIGLTPQMVKRFAAYLQSPVATLHSGMNDRERHCAWHSMRTGEVSVLLGTRSAVFAPFKNLGLCILDEEHDLSYKQQDGFRYSARDFLVRRASLQKVPVVLGSATPSLESLHNVTLQRYRKLVLDQRAGQASLPQIKVLDIRGEKVQQGVSAPLKAAMEQHLKNGSQVLLFLNRRGFAPVLMCHECGWQATCPSCDANMTYHQGKMGGYLQCHHCDTQLAIPESCPKCQSEELVKIGQGTERLEETIKEWFPDKTVLRIDRDSTRLKGSMAKMTEQAKSGQADILLGTQMLAKGHDFPKVTLVGLLEIDQGLFSCDFRATERLAQLVMQVAGRAGRGELSGEVLIQSHHPQHPLLTQLIREGYAEVAGTLLTERQQARLPPFCFQILIRAEAHNEALVRDFLFSIKGGLELVWKDMQSEINADAEDISFSIWGPIAAPMLRRQGRYRYQLMLNSNSRKHLHQLLAAIEPSIYKSPMTRKVRWNIDVDPQEML